MSMTDIINKYSRKDIGNAKALLLDLPVSRRAKGEISAVIEEILKLPTEPPRRQAVVPCPECGAATVQHGCKARKCESCGHQYKPNWHQLERFGRHGTDRLG